MKEKFIYTPIPKPERPLTRVERLFASGAERSRSGNLKEQYKFQIKALLETGVLELMPEGNNVGYYDFKNQVRPVPSYDEIMQRMEQNYDTLETKYKQGFTQLQLTPQLVSLSFLIDRTRDEILKAKKEGRLKATDGTELKLHERLQVFDHNLLKAETKGSLVYFPQRFQKTNHGGLTKEGLIDSPDLFRGYLITLTEDLPDLPAEGNGKIISGRKQIEANKSSLEYINLLQTDSQYTHETGITPEQWLIYFLTNLKRGRAIDIWSGERGGSKKGKLSFNFAGFLLARSPSISYGYWNSDEGYVELGWSSLDDPHSLMRVPNYSARSAVILRPVS